MMVNIKEVHMHLLVTMYTCFSSYPYITAYVCIYKYYVKKHMEEVFNLCIDNE